MDIPPGNITQTESSEPEDCTGSVAKEITVPIKFVSASVLPEELGEELWRVAGAELVELSKAEFAHALETIGATDNFGLDPGKQADERHREMFWRALHLEELAIARGCALGREAAWRRFFAQYQEQLTRAAVEMTGSAALGEELASALYSAKPAESVSANGTSGAVEEAHEPWIECHHAGSEHEQPICDSKNLSLPERTHLVDVGEGHCSQDFRRCSKVGTSDIMQKTKQMMNQINDPRDMWEVELLDRMS